MSVEKLSAALADRYRVERELGQGGMATVYLAADLRHDRKVALKVLRPELAAILGGERFLAEIKTTANLQHPHILSLFDSGEADGLVFYVMPYVDGESLRDRLNREKQLPVDDAVRIATEVADALQYAHEHKIVHRDIKPENILLHGGHALVADFGIALAASRSDGGTRMTETGMSLGTPHYMAPEQAMGEREITPKADIYALGCVLYEMLTAEPPFVGATAQAIIARVMTEEPRSLTLQRRSVPPHVEAVVRKALEKLPADRFASASDFGAALSSPDFAAAAAGGPARAAATRRSRFAMPAVLLGTAALMLGAGFLGGRRTATGRAQLLQFSIDLPDSVQVTGRCCGPSLALSPEGRTLVFVGNRAGGGPLFRRTVGRLDAEPIPGTEGASIPFFSPDGRWLGFYSEGHIRKVSMAGGPPIPIVAADVAVGASWAAGDVIVYVSHGLKTVPASGGQPHDVALRDSSTRFMYPFALPGGSAALVSIRSLGSASEGWRIGVVDLASGKVDTLGFGGRAEYASGNLVFSGADNTLLAQPFDPKSRRTTGDAVAIVGHVRLNGSSNHEFAVSDGGSLAYSPGTSDAGEALKLAGPAGLSLVEVPGRTDANLEDPAVSPDGRLIALRLSPPSGAVSSTQDLWLLNRQQGTLDRFTVGGGYAPVWSRDGLHIAYSVPDSGPQGPAGIYLKTADQTGTPRMLLRANNVYPESWLPDGRTLVFQQERPGTGTDIGSIAIGDSTPHWLLATEFSERHPQVSPDGRWLAYNSNRTGQREIYVMPLGSSGGAVQVSAQGGTSPRWAPDGRTLYYEWNDAIIGAALAPGRALQVTGRRTVVQSGVTDINSQNVNWDIYPNGREFLFIDLLSGASSRPVWVIDWPVLAASMRTGQR